MFFYFPDGNWPPCGIFKSFKFYMLGGLEDLDPPDTMSNFLETGLSIAEILQFYDFSRWPPPPYLIIKIINIFG